MHVAALNDLELSAGRHHAHLHARFHVAVHQAHINDNALVRVVLAVKDQRTQRCVRVASRRRDIGYDALEHLVDIQACLLYTSQYRVATTLDGQEVAQLMLVIGTDASGLTHPNWRDNMNFAVNLQADLNGAYPDLMRDVNLRSQRFNTHLRSGSILLECGSSGNTLQEAIRAVKLFGNVLADRLLA